jgi:hypothetical protein
VPCDPRVTDGEGAAPVSEAKDDVMGSLS